MGLVLLWAVIATICTIVGALLVKMTWVDAALYWLLILYIEIAVTMIYGWITTRRMK